MMMVASITNIRNATELTVHFQMVNFASCKFYLNFLKKWNKRWTEGFSEVNLLYYFSKNFTVWSFEPGNSPPWTDFVWCEVRSVVWP